MIVNNKYGVFVLALLAIVLSACGDDDHAFVNYVAFGDDKVEMNYGAVVLATEPLATVQGRYVYRHYLIIKSAPGRPTTGLHHDVSFQVISDTLDLADGTYTYLQPNALTSQFELAADLDAAQFRNAGGTFATDFDSLSVVDQRRFYEVKSGTGTVKKSGKVYTIDFQGKGYSKERTSVPLDVRIHFSGRMERSLY